MFVKLAKITFLLSFFVISCGTFIVNTSENEKIDNYIQNENIFRVNEHNVKSIYDVKIQDLTRVYVNRVVDGETLIVDIKDPPEGLNARERVVLLGVNTGENDSRQRNSRDNRNRRENYPPSGAAYNYMKEIVEKQYMYLAFDWELRDRTGSLLAYAFFKSGGDLNGIFIREGVAKVNRRQVFHFEEEFLYFERYAQSRRTGIWR